MRYAILSSSGIVVENIVAQGAGVLVTTPATRVVALGANEWCSPGAQYRASSTPRFIDVSTKTWTAYQFLSRFTPAELDAVRVRSQTDPAMWRFLTFASAAQEVVSDDPVTMQGMDYLVSCGIVTQARRDAILSA